MPKRISFKKTVATATGFCTGLFTAMQLHAVRIVVVGGLALFCLAGAPMASAAPPCCGVTNIAKDGQITAKETNGARTFQFQVTDPALLRGLRVGAPVYANFDTKQVSLDGKKPCCTIVKISTAAKQPAQPVAEDVRVSLWWRSHGGDFAAGTDLTKPAVLLIHGLNQTGECWLRPAKTIGEDYFLDPHRTPSKKKKNGEDRRPPGTPYKVGLSPQVQNIDQNNWFDFLRSRGFTVATWSQGKESNFHEALPTALEALDRFAADTAALNPAAPPPIALVAHSRGGLIARGVLKQKGNAGDRIRWLVTLHSPHQGSEMGRAAAQMGAEILDVAGQLAPTIDLGPFRIDLSGGLKDDLKRLLVEALRPLNKLAFGDGEPVIQQRQRELMPDSPLLRELRAGEAPVPGVRYITFGGTNATYYRAYLWAYTSSCANPLEDCYVQPYELPLVSPMFDKVRDFVPEIAEGKGDGLVAEARSRLPWPNVRHEVTRLNHAEVLWDRDLQQKVARLLLPSHKPTPSPVPPRKPPVLR